VLSRIRTEISRIGGIGVGFLYLSDIGITFEEDGTLKVDDGKLTTSLEGDSKGVGDLFLLTENGLGKRIPDLIDDFISSVDGSLTAREEGVTASISRIDDKIERETRRIAAFEERLVKQFTNLEQMISIMNSQADFLSKQLSMLANLGR
jgi:flagellar hook-associated protein 2